MNQENIEKEKLYKIYEIEKDLENNLKDFKKLYNGILILKKISKYNFFLRIIFTIDQLFFITASIKDSIYPPSPIYKRFEQIIDKMLLLGESIEGEGKFPKLEKYLEEILIIKSLISNEKPTKK